MLLVVPVNKNNAMRKLILAFVYLISVKGISQVSLAFSRQMEAFLPSPFVSTADGGYVYVKKTDITGDKKGRTWKKGTW